MVEENDQTPDFQVSIICIKSAPIWGNVIIILRIVEWETLLSGLCFKIMKITEISPVLPNLLFPKEKIGGELILNSSSFQKEASPNYKNPITKSQIQKVIHHQPPPIPCYASWAPLWMYLEDLVCWASDYTGSLLWSEEAEGALRQVDRRHQSRSECSKPVLFKVMVVWTLP